MTDGWIACSTFAILTSPLILGNDPRNMTKACLDIIANKEIIALNQVPVVCSNRLLFNLLVSAIEVMTCDGLIMTGPSGQSCSTCVSMAGRELGKCELGATLFDLAV